MAAPIGGTVKSENLIDAAAKYVARCRRAGDRRSTAVILEDVISRDDAGELAPLVEQRWVV